MVRIPDDYLQSVVFVYPSEQAARDGGQVGGSGFVVACPSGVKDRRLHYVVTNAHIMENGGQWIRLNHPSGTHIAHIPAEQWETSPPDDIAVALLPSHPPQVSLFPIPLENYALTRQEIENLSVGPGDQAERGPTARA